MTGMGAVQGPVNVREKLFTYPVSRPHYCQLVEYGPNPAKDGGDRLKDVAAALTAAIVLMLSEGVACSSTRGPSGRFRRSKLSRL